MTIPTPIAAWNLNGDATDETGNYDGTATGVTFVDDYADFDGVNDSILIGGGLSNASNDNHTFVFAVNPDTLSNEEFLLDAQTGRFILALQDAGANDSIGFFNGSAWNVTGTNASTGSWQHVMFVFDSTTCKIYLDNTLIGDITSVSDNLGGNIRLGSHNNGASSLYDGKMKNVYIWDSALSDAQRNEWYNSGSPQVYTSGGGWAAPGGAESENAISFGVNF